MTRVRATTTTTQNGLTARLTHSDGPNVRSAACFHTRHFVATGNTTLEAASFEQYTLCVVLT
jgi:hypothetical protein